MQDRKTPSFQVCHSRQNMKHQCQFVYNIDGSNIKKQMRAQNSNRTLVFLNQRSANRPPGAQRPLGARTHERTMVKDARIEKDKATNSLHIVFRVDILTSSNQNFKQYFHVFERIEGYTKEETVVREGKEVGSGK